MNYVKSNISNFFKNKKIVTNRNKIIRRFEKNFIEILFEKGVYNSLDQTITTYNYRIVDKDGAEAITANLAFPKGLSIDDLNRCTESLRQNLYGKCLIVVNEDENNVYISAIRKFHSMKYKPVKLSHASQMFLGYTIDFKPITVDFSKNPNLLISGSTGSGK